MPSQIFAIPVLGRYGLTHGLLAWARASVWCEQNGAVMLAPFWLKLRIGPYLRRERDKRNYFMLFGRVTATAGLRRLQVLAQSRKIEVGDHWSAVPATDGSPFLLRFHNAMKDKQKTHLPRLSGMGRSCAESCWR